MRKILFPALFTCFAFAATAQTGNENTGQTSRPTDTSSLAHMPKLTKASVDEKIIYETIDVEPSVSIDQWRRHLEKHLQAPIEKAAKKGMKTGIYTVEVRFLVEKDGRISEAAALNDPGYGLAEASVKVVKTGPRWTAGIYKGSKVRSYHTQPLTFVISEK